MNKEQEKHLQRVKDVFETSVDAKYRAGQKEHGGDLWLKAGLIDMAIDEAIDQVVYLMTLKDQLNSGEYYNMTKTDDASSN